MQRTIGKKQHDKDQVGCQKRHCHEEFIKYSTNRYGNGHHVRFQSFQHGFKSFISATKLQRLIGKAYSKLITFFTNQCIADRRNIYTDFS